VSHWSDFDIRDGSVFVGRLRKVESGYWYIEDSNRGFKYARKVIRQNIKEAVEQPATNAGQNGQP